MKKLYIITAILVTTLFNSCALHTMHKNNYIANSPNVELSQDNFHVVKHVSSSASCTYIFGIGGLSKKALKQNAVADMISKAELEGPQTVVNVITKVSRTAITPLYIKETVTAQGTVIEFDGPSLEYTKEVK